MGFISRVKSGAGTGKPVAVMASATTPYVTPSASVFEVTGTTAITGFSTLTPILPGREITLMGTDATGPAFTDTAVGSTANGAIHLSAALTLANGSTVTLRQFNNGSWWETARAING